MTWSSTSNRGPLCGQVVVYNVWTTKFELQTAPTQGIRLDS